jgi:hypothetical protein
MRIGESFIGGFSLLRRYVSKAIRRPALSEAEGFAHIRHS